MRTLAMWTAATALVVAAAAGCTSTNKVSSAHAPTPVVPVAPPPGQPGVTVGGSRAVTPTAGQTITQAQVRSYVLSHPVADTLQTTKVQVASITFVSAQQVPLILGTARLGVPATEPVCLVLLTGTFVFPGPPGATPTFPVGVEIFDAKTGNLLQSGGLPAMPRRIAP